MNYLDKTIVEIHEALLSKKVSVLELTKEALKELTKTQIMLLN